jgi:hypothetical protein
MFLLLTAYAGIITNNNKTSEAEAEATTMPSTINENNKSDNRININSPGTKTRTPQSKYMLFHLLLPTMTSL